MAEITKTLEVTWHFAEIEDETNEVVKTRKISFAVPANAQASNYTTRFETFKNDYLASFSTTNSASEIVGSILQASGWADDDYDHDGSNANYKCVNITADFLEKTKTEVG